MSYDISLVDPVTGNTLELDSVHQMSGGTYAIGGTKEAWLNVTYNYARWYFRDDVFPSVNGENKGIRTIYGLSGADSIPVLEKAIEGLSKCTEELPDDEYKSLESQEIAGYWMPTRVNAIKPLYQLLSMAKLRPDGVWSGD